DRSDAQFELSILVVPVKGMPGRGLASALIYIIYRCGPPSTAPADWRSAQKDRLERRDDLVRGEAAEVPGAVAANICDAVWSSGPVESGVVGAGVIMAGCTATSTGCAAGRSIFRWSCPFCCSSP